MTTTPVVPLRRLTAKGQRAAARPLALVWQDVSEQPVAEEDILARRLAGQFLAGEQLAAGACERLQHQVSLPEARDCLALQAEDEYRHADLFRRYLEGHHSAVGESVLLRLVAQRLLAWQGPPEAVMLALHVILEGEALALQEVARRHTRCPRFAALSRVIARDEARHVAFGQHYLPAALAQLTPSERRAIFVWLRGLWFDSLELLPQGLPLPGFTKPFIRHWSRRRWAGWQPQLAALGLLDAPGGRDHDEQAVTR